MTHEAEGPHDPESVEQEERSKLKKPAVPDGFESEVDFLRWATKLYATDVDNDNDNRIQAIEDMKFVAGDQWEDDIITQRQNDMKPTLTLNRLPAFVGQLIGNRRLNQTNIKILPDNDADKDVARIREGLIRSIQKLSNADFVFDKAHEGQVISGMGNFKVELEFASDDVFEQDVRIKGIPNPLSVVWDRMSFEPTGGDARHAFVDDNITKEDFRREYPEATGGSLGNVREYLTGNGIDATWFENDVFRISEFWRMKTRRRTIALLTPDAGQGENQVEDITDQDFDEIADRIVTDAEGMPIMREVDRKFAEMYLITATDILEGPYELPIDRVPVFKVTGWELNVGEKRVRFGLIRFMKDPQRLHNYWRSILAEKLMLTPKVKWIAGQRAIEGREPEWREAHLSNDSLLVYNDEEGAQPQQAPSAQLEPALIQEAGMASQDLFDISNLHQASLGQQSNEVSGRAILARQRVGEVGTAIYETNLQRAIEACGHVINQLIPVVYDTARTVKILGEDGKDIPAVLINDTTDEKSVDITLGKYSVTSTTGPSTVTKRVEAAESMLNMVNAAPQTMAIAMDKIIEAQDWPGAREIAERLRTQLPPGVIQPGDMTDEEQEARNAAQQARQAAQQREDAILEADLAEKQGRAMQAQGLGLQAQANAAKTFSEVGIRASELAEKAEGDRARVFLEAVALFQDVTKPEAEDAARDAIENPPTL